MSEISKKGERGLAVFTEMMGPEQAEMLRASATSGKFASGISNMALEFAFADAWGQGGLPKRERSAMIIGILIAQRQTSELRNHVKIGAANGLTVPDFESLLLQATPYVGFPCIASATTVVIEALREIGMDPNVETSEERGLL